MKIRTSPLQRPPYIQNTLHINTALFEIYTFLKNYPSSSSIFIFLLNMSSPCTKRPRNEEDPHMSPDDLPSPPKRSRAQQARGKKPVSSSQANGDDDDETSTEPTSSSGSDSSEESSDEENDSENEEKGKPDGNEQETIPSITARPKPRIHRIKQNSDILSRINAFLPQMKNANENLQRELDAGRGKQIQLDHDEGYEGEGEGEGEGKEDQGYIEMVRFSSSTDFSLDEKRSIILTFSVYC